MPQVQIPTHKDWMASTGGEGLFSGRSAQLKSLDGAILEHNKQPDDARMAVVASAWRAWRAKKRDNTDIGLAKRNKKKGVAVIQQALIESGHLAYEVAGLNPNYRVEVLMDPPDARVSDSHRAIVDKALAETVVAVNDIIAALQGGSASTTKLVKLWFGSTSAATVQKKFEKVKQTIEGYRSEVGPDPLTLKLRIAMGNKSAFAAANVKAPQNPMYLYNMFFEDEVMGRTNTYMFKRLTSSPSVTQFLQARQAGQEKIALIDDKGKKSKETQELGLQLMRLESDTRTRYGILLHEFTHMSLGTEDVAVSQLVGVHGITDKATGCCYGASMCELLAARHPDLALKNADNYRLFAETCRF